MVDMTIKYGEEIILPVAVRDRYGLTSDTPIRIIETRSGILLIPLTTEPMSADLQEEWRTGNCSIRK